MAIQMRRGLSADFDPTKMLAGEWAVTIDPDTQHQIVYMCFGAGIVKRMGTLEDFETWLTKELIPYTQKFDEIYIECTDLRDEVIQIRDSLIPAAEMALKVPELVEEAKGYANAAREDKEFIENAIDVNIPTFEVDTNTGFLFYSGGLFNFAINNDGYLCYEFA